jgi:glycogen synthase
LKKKNYLKKINKIIMKKSEKIIPLCDKVFEVSYEVCNRVGGIYRVLESKADKMTDHYDDKYFLIGPYYRDKAKGEFKEEAPPLEFKRVFQKLETEGLRFHYGKWLVKGKPNVILIDFSDYFYKVDEIKKEMWDDFGVDSLHSGYDFNEPVCWSYASGRLIREISSEFKNENIVAHFHEWLSGAGLLYLKAKKTKVKTVFTTHATSLGRTLAFHSINFYKLFDKIVPDEEARKYGVFQKHTIEKASAKEADVFTTVSEITGIEAEKFLSRKPDIILPNGLDIEKFLSFEDIVVKHRIQRKLLRNFVASYFFPYYTFDLEETLFYFIIGRNELRAKGIDIFISSLGKLNKKMREEKSKRTIISFLFIPADVRGINPSLLENVEYFRDVQETFESTFSDIEERMLYNILREKKLTKENLISEDYLLEIEKKLHRMKRSGETPSLSTHHLNSLHDEIINHLKEADLLNREEDRVKVIYYPIYLTGHDGLSNLSYEEALEACHMGVFPSFYEPWGYTPLEAAALGVSSVTTDLAGFGRFCTGLKRKKDKPGIYVLEREKKDDEVITEDLYKFLYDFMKTTRRERVENKIEARKIAAQADWQSFVINYIKAHNKAFEK